MVRWLTFICFVFALTDLHYEYLFAIQFIYLINYAFFSCSAHYYNIEVQDISKPNKMASIPPNNLNNNIQISSNALDAHINNIRANIPPSIKNACCPDSTSTFLRNILLTLGILNVLLALTSLFVIGVKFMGLSILLIAFVSCIHVTCLTLVLGNHVADTISGLGLLPLANTLRNTSSRYGTDAYMHGAMFGSTLLMALLFHVISSYYGGLAECVTANAATAWKGQQQQHLTGGYGDSSTHNNNSSSSIEHHFDPYSACGASGPVGFVSFLSGLLFWANAVFSVTLYTKREELLSGMSLGRNDYDEIGGGFAGDFPPGSSQGMRTMQV